MSDSTKLDPSNLPFDYSHLHEGERNRIKAGQYDQRETLALLRDENPWPNPYPPKKDDTSTPEDIPKPAGGIRVHGGRRSPTEKEEENAALLRFMGAEVRAIYDCADSEQKALLWEANKGAFEAAEKRKEERLLRERERTEKVLDMLQRVKEDPSKAHLLPPAEASLDDLHMWFEKMSQPVRNVPFPDPPRDNKPNRPTTFPSRFGSANGGEVSAPLPEPPKRRRSGKGTDEKKERAGSGFDPKPIQTEPWQTSRFQGLFDESPKQPTHTGTSEYFRPNRGWFLGAAGVVAAWILDRVDAPLWLAMITLGVLLICAGIWPWIDKTKKRRAWFWGLLMLYAVATFITAVAFAVPKGAIVQVDIKATPTPIPSVAVASSPPATPSQSPKPSPSPSTADSSVVPPSPTLTPKAPFSDDVKLGLLQCNVSGYEEPSGYRALKQAVCIAKNQQTGQEFIGTVGEEQVANINLPLGLYVVTIKAEGYITRVEAVKIEAKVTHVALVLQKMQ